MDEKKVAVLSRKDIARIIPHRRTARMIDRVLYDSVMSPNMLVGHKGVYENDPWLAGHYPGNPLFPGHCQLECAQLVAAILIFLRFPQERGVPVVAGANGLRWKEPVRPGDHLIITTYFVERKMDLFICKANIVNQYGKITAKFKEIIGTIIV